MHSDSEKEVTRNHIESPDGDVQFGERHDMLWAGMLARLNGGMLVQAAYISSRADMIRWVEPYTNGKGREISATDLNGVDHDYAYDWRHEMHVAEWEQPTPEQLAKTKVLWLVLSM